MKTIDRLVPGQPCRLGFKHGDEPAVFMKIEGEGSLRRATFRQKLHSGGWTEWEAYRYQDRWVYGTSADRLRLVEAPPWLTEEQQDQALAIVAAWLGPQLGHDGPAPTGLEAAWFADGPMLDRLWSWTKHPTCGGGTPTILLEGGPDDWAIEASGDLKVVAALKKIGVFAEPYAAYALCLYVAED